MVKFLNRVRAYSLMEFGKIVLKMDVNKGKYM